MAIPSIPDVVDNDPINVQERLIKQVDCPNPECKETLDITNSNIGTKIKCGQCNNVTWIPDYRKKWWQKPLNIIGGMILSLVIGFAASVAADWYTSGRLESNSNPIESMPSNNQINQGQG